MRGGTLRASSVDLGERAGHGPHRGLLASWTTGPPGRTGTPAPAARLLSRALGTATFTVGLWPTRAAAALALPIVNYSLLLCRENLNTTVTRFQLSQLVRANCASRTCRSQWCAALCVPVFSVFPLSFSFPLQVSASGESKLSRPSLQSAGGTQVIANSGHDDMIVRCPAAAASVGSIDTLQD